MKNHQIIEMAISLGFIAIILTFLIALLFYFIYRKVMKKENILQKRYIVFGMLFCMYLIIVFGVTMVADGTRGFADYRMKIHFFESYKQAWNTMSITEWRNLVLNILLFVPMGCILPILFKRCKLWWLTYGIGFMFSLTIEMTQLITKRGMCEADDLLNNTLGCMIGFGLYYLCRYIYYKKQYSLKKACLFQVPLLLTLVSFTSLAVVYNRQELGNLKSKYNAVFNMSYIELSHDLNLDDHQPNGYVYKKSTNHKDILNLFTEQYQAIDEYSYLLTIQNKDYELQFDEDGLFVLSMQSDDQYEGLENLKYQDLKKILESYGVSFDKRVDVFDAGHGMYEITFSFLKNHDYMINGSILCTIDTNRQLRNVESHLSWYTPYKEYTLLSSKEAYQMIEEGKISEYYGMLDSKIHLNHVTLSYELDSKGYYQPVYIFSYQSNNETKVIYIPAMKS